MNFLLKKCATAYAFQFAQTYSFGNIPTLSLREFQSYVQNERPSYLYCVLWYEIKHDETLVRIIKKILIKKDFPCWLKKVAKKMYNSFSISSKQFYCPRERKLYKSKIFWSEKYLCMDTGRFA